MTSEIIIAEASKTARSYHVTQTRNRVRLLQKTAKEVNIYYVLLFIFQTT